MRRNALFPIVALVALAACQDGSRNSPLPTGADKPSLSTTAEAAATGASAGTTVCLAYVKEREEARTELENNPGNPELQDKITSLNDIVADVCN